MNEKASMFLGVNEGYRGEDAEVKLAWQAARIVRRMITGQPEYQAYPALVVYHELWGCPVGGEVCSLVTSTAKFSDTLAKAKTLQIELKQKTLSVVANDGNDGARTLGFVGEFSDISLKDIALAWQSNATKLYNESQDKQFYVSAGFYQKENGVVAIQGAANPTYVKNKDEWSEAVKKLTDMVEADLGVNLNINSHEVGFTYMVKPQEISNRIDTLERI
jgi:hypothetical protein